MMVVPRGQDMDERCCVEETGSFLLRSCRCFAGGCRVGGRGTGLGYRKANSEARLSRAEYAGGGGGRGLSYCSEDRELSNQEPCSKSSDVIRFFSSSLGFGLRKNFPTLCKYPRSHTSVVAPAPTIMTG